MLSFDGDTQGSWLGDVALCVPVARDQARARSRRAARVALAAGRKLLAEQILRQVEVEDRDHEQDDERERGVA